MDEARTLARFDHRNIVKVHRYFEANGTAYIVMEYAEGETLADYLSRKGTLDEAELKRVLTPILDGLETVHGADFLHRDVKPSNIVIRDEEASPVLLDFGAARHAVNARSRSVTTIVTPGYAPIEQYSSRGKQGPWTDIYALGAVCYKALTGETPVDSIDRLTDDPLESVVKRCSGKRGRGFLKAVDWALNVKEGDRPQTIASWRAAISSSASTPTKVLPSTISTPQSENTQPKLKRSQWAIVIVILALVVSGIVMVKQQSEKKAEEARRVASEKAREATREWEEAFRGSQPRAAEEAKRAAAEAERQRQARAAEESRRAAAEAGRVRQTEPAEEARRAAAEAERARQARAAEEARRVAAEAERARQARAAEEARRAAYFTLGSHQDDVLRLQGTPSSIQMSLLTSTENWIYGLDEVTIDRRTQKVVKWNDYTGNLKVRLQPGSQTTRSTYFTLGSHQDDVLRLQGTPSSIQTLTSTENWSYGLDEVTIDRRTQKVVKWNDYTGNLKVRLQPGSQTTRSTYFTLGSHQDDVLRLQGTPSSIQTLTSTENWSYGLDEVTIDRRTQKVVKWNDYTGNLKVRLQPGSQTTRSTYFTLGSHQDDVLRLQGTPSSIQTLTSTENWSYGLDEVTIDRRTQKVVKWNDYTGNLKVRLQPGSQTTRSTYFTLGSHQDDVLRLQGTPSSIQTLTSTENWSYGLDEVTIDRRTQKVVKWNDYTGNLKVRLQSRN